MKQFLQPMPSAKIIGEAQDARQTLQFAEQFCPDYIILDPEFSLAGSSTHIASDFDGDICYKLKALSKPSYIVAYTHLAAVRDLMALMSAGVDAYVHKNTALNLLESVPERIKAGERVWIMNPTIQYAQSEGQLSEYIDLLTPKQREVIQFILKDCLISEMAHRTASASSDSKEAHHQHPKEVWY